MQSIAETCVRFDAAHLSINLVSEIAVPMFTTLKQSRGREWTTSLQHGLEIYIPGTLEPFTLKWPLFEVLGPKLAVENLSICHREGCLSKALIVTHTCLTSIFVNSFFAFTIVGWFVSTFSFPVPDVVLGLLALDLDLLTPYVVTVHMRCCVSTASKSSTKPW